MALNEPTLAQVKRAAANHFGLQPADMASARKEFSVSHPRQLAMLVAARITSKSYTQIGLGFGGRDHSTIIHGVRVAEKRVATDPVWAGHYQAIRGALGA